MAQADRLSASRPPAVRVRWYAVVALLGHCMLLAIGSYSLWAIADGGVPGGIAAGACALLYLLMWRFLLAAGSRKRLPDRERLALTIIVVPVVVVLAALSHAWLTALIAGSFVLLGDALDGRSMH